MRQKIFIISALVGLFVCLPVVLIHTLDQVWWHRHFDDLRQSIQSCNYDILKWNGRYDDMRQQAQSTEAVSLPLRGQTHVPKLAKDEALVLTCPISNVTEIYTEFAWVSLGRVFGETVVFWGDRQVTSTKGGDRLEFPVPPDMRGATTLTIISRDDGTGAVGPWTLIPPYLTTNKNQHSRVERYLGSFYGEQPTFKLGLVAVIILLISVLWIGGVRYEDLSWLAFFAAMIGLQHFAIYLIQIYPDYFDVWSRIQGSALVLQMIGFVGALAAYSRPTSSQKEINRLLVILSVGTIVTYSIIPEQYYFDLRLKVFTPLCFGLIMVLVCVAFLVQQHRTSSLQTKRDRITRGIILASLASAFLLAGIVLDERLDINIHSSVQLIFVISGLLVVSTDLVKRYKDFFRILDQQQSNRMKLESSKALNDKLLFIQHDILKPLRAIEESGEGVGLKNHIAEIKNILSQDHEKREVLNLKKLIDEAYGIASLRYPMRTCDFSNRLDEDPKVEVVSTTFERVLVNIFCNAFDHTSTDFDLAVACLLVDGSIEITVTNTGSSIPETQLESVFEKGYSTNNEHGVGLGLAFCKKVIEEDHNGALRVNSLGKTVSFTIVLPAIDNNTKRLIVIDDDPIILTAWEIENEVETIALRSVEEFQHWLTSTELRSNDMIITDLILDGNRTGGLEVLKLARAKRESAKVFLSTNYKDVSEIKKSFDGVIPKTSPPD